MKVVFARRMSTSHMACTRVRRLGKPRPPGKLDGNMGSPRGKTLLRRLFELCGEFAKLTNEVCLRYA